MTTAVMNTMATAVLAAGALVASPAGAQPMPPPAPADLTSARPPGASELRVALAYSVLRTTNFFSDGHYTDVPTFDAGIEAEYFHVPGRVFHWGVGLRYGAGVGTRSFGANQQTEVEHLAFVPLLIGWSARLDDIGDELGLNLGLGPAFGAFGYAQRYIWTDGIGAELGVTFVHPLGRDLAFTAGVTARLVTLNAFSEMSGSYIDTGLHAEIPFHVGVRYRL